MEIGKEYKGFFGLKFLCVWRDERDDTFALLCIDSRRGGFDYFGKILWASENGTLPVIGGNVVPWTE